MTSKINVLYFFMAVQKSIVAEEIKYVGNHAPKCKIVTFGYTIFPENNYMEGPGSATIK